MEVLYTSDTTFADSNRESCLLFAVVLFRSSILVKKMEIIGIFVVTKLITVCTMSVGAKMLDIGDVRFVLNEEQPVKSTRDSLDYMLVRVAPDYMSIKRQDYGYGGGSGYGSGGSQCCQQTAQQQIDPLALVSLLGLGLLALLLFYEINNNNNSTMMNGRRRRQARENGIAFVAIFIKLKKNVTENAQG